MLKFCVKVFKISISKSLHGFTLYLACYAYRYWSKILFATIPIPAYDLEVKVTEIYVKVLRQSF